jgi:hypothetical protein
VPDVPRAERRPVSGAEHELLAALDSVGAALAVLFGLQRLEDRYASVGATDATSPPTRDRIRPGPKASISKVASGSARAETAAGGPMPVGDAYC